MYPAGNPSSNHARAAVPCCAMLSLSLSSLSQALCYGVALVAAIQHVMRNFYPL